MAEREMRPTQSDLYLLTKFRKAKHDAEKIVYLQVICWKCI